nr:hypothetical protein [Tanacetum cinerariifolium]
MSNDKESSAAGTDNRAPMLEEDDYESWKIRMERYIRSKGDGKKVWKSIMSGPAPTPRSPILDATRAATTQTREKTDDEFTKEENARELIDYKAASILGQGLPRHIFNTLNQSQSTQEIWESVALLMQGSGLSDK